MIFIGGGRGFGIAALLLFLLLLTGGRGSPLLAVLLLFVLAVFFVPMMMLRSARRVVLPPSPHGWDLHRPPGHEPYPRDLHGAPDPRGWDEGTVDPGPPVVPADVVSLRDRLAQDVRALDPGADPVARQAAADAAERLETCTTLLERARSEGQLRTAWHAAVEGLTAARVVRARLGLDPGPPIPLPPSTAPQLSQRSRVLVGGTEHVGSPTYEPGLRHWFPGGYYGGRPVPGGWYAAPFWETAVLAGAAGALFGGLAAGGLFGGWDEGDWGGGDGGFGGFGGGGGWDGGGGGDWGGFGGFGGGGDWGGGGGDFGGGGDW